MQIGKILFHIFLFHLVYTFLELDHQLHHSLSLFFMLAIAVLHLHPITNILGKLHPEIKSCYYFNRILILHGPVFDHRIFCDLLQVYNLLYFLLQCREQLGVQARQIGEVQGVPHD